MSTISEFVPTRSTAEWQTLDSAHHLHPFTDHAALSRKGTRVITHAEGVYLYDSDGNRMLDGMAGLWCVTLGYGRSELVEAARQQMLQLPYYNSFFQTAHPPAIELARLLVEVTPAQFKHVFFTGSGSESIDTVVRLVRRYWELCGEPKRTFIISRENAYHGSTVAGTSLGGMDYMRAQGGPPLLMDGHVHIINRVYWEGIDAWQEQPGIGWDYARARKAGVNCVIDNIGTYGAWNYNYSPKQALRLIETAHRFAGKHADKMAIAFSVADARSIMASGRVAVFLGCESGIDHEGDIEVLGALHRLGLRTIQFATQTGYNAFSDSALAALQGGQPTDTYKGITERGRKLVAEMNRLGVLIDITHGTDAVQMQLIEASRAPVVASQGRRRSKRVSSSEDAIWAARCTAVMFVSPCFRNSS